MIGFGLVYGPKLFCQCIMYIFFNFKYKKILSMCKILLGFHFSKAQPLVAQIEIIFETEPKKPNYFRKSIDWLTFSHRFGSAFKYTTLKPIGFVYLTIKSNLTDRYSPLIMVTPAIWYRSNFIN